MTVGETHTTGQSSFEELRSTLDQLTHHSDHTVAAMARRARAALESLELKESSSEEDTPLAALYRISQVLGSSLNLEKVLRATMDSVIQLTGAERGFLMLINEETNDLDLMAARNMQQEDLDRDEMEISRTIVEAAIQRGEGVITTNAQQDERFSKQESVSRYALRSIMCQPLLTRGKTVGAVYVDNKIKTGMFEEKELELLGAFAAQAAAAIENARLYTHVDAELAQRVRELKMLGRVDRDLSSGLDAEKILKRTLYWALRGTQSESGWIGVQPEALAPVNVLYGVDRGASFDLDELPQAQLLRQGESVIHELPSGDKTMIAAARREDDSLVLIAVLRAQPNYSEDSQRFLVRLADRAAIAIENTRLYQTAQQAIESKSQFISMVAHELKIPMTSIRGYADLIRQGTVGEVSDGQVQFLDTIRNNVDRMADLISDLSDISQLESGRLKIETRPLPLADCVRTPIADLRPQIDEKDHSIHLEIPDGLPMIYADPNRLIQILTNLISNANKYTPSGGKITIRAQQLDDQLRVSIIDTGIGLSEADQDHLFEQFYRSENPDVREQVGWGLGLYVTRRLVEIMGGEIGAESAQGQGSTFWFTIPTAEQGGQHA
ncbi:MAG: GAF domain-containing sensor histidine kinase [Anaerolineales bacterium]|jgi:signal transduction histidine kinase